MTRTLITLAAAAFVVSAHAGTMGSAGHATGSWPYGSPEALSQSSATRLDTQAHKKATRDGATTAGANDTRTMDAPAAPAVRSQWPYGSPEALSQSSATRW